MVIISYILFAIPCLVVLGMIFSGLNIFFSDMKESSKKEKKEKIKKIFIGLLVYAAMGIIGYLIYYFIPSLFPHEPTAKEIALERYPWIDDDQSEDYYQGIIDAMNYDFD